MEKLTRILAVVESRENGAVVLEKAVTLARCCGARVELMVAELTHGADLAAMCRAMNYNEVTLSRVRRGAAPLHEVILRHVLESHPDLVVKAPAGMHPLHRWTLDDNDWRLANECPVRQYCWCAT